MRLILDWNQALFNKWVQYTQMNGISFTKIDQHIKNVSMAIEFIK